MRRCLHDLIPLSLAACSLLLSACSGSSIVEPSAERIVYRVDSPYADVLLSCTTFTSIEESCFLSQLPFIGDGVTTPSVEDIMDRVIVQEPWMGERFEAILMRAPEDARWLLSSVTHVELAGNSPGDFYRTWAGGIKMSAQPLWLTDDERFSMDFSDVADNRFATRLQFRHPWSNYQQGDAYDEFNRPTSTRKWDESRDFDRIYLSFMDGLYHELSHAATYVHPTQLTTINGELRVHEVTYPVQGEDVRELLTGLYPLNIEQLRPLAKSYYVGSEIDARLERLSADDVIAEFSDEGAMELYAYFSDSEDIATLFQATMMKYHFGAGKTVGFADKPIGAVNCDSIVLKWGVHDRLMNPLVAQRAELVANFILSGHDDLTSFFTDQTASERVIETNTPWCDVRDGR